MERREIVKHASEIRRIGAGPIFKDAHGSLRVRRAGEAMVADLELADFSMRVRLGEQEARRFVNETRRAFKSEG